MKNLTFKIRGVVPLLCHNGQLADPLNGFAISLKQISKKKTKTEEDHKEMGRIEFLGSLYINNDGKLCLPPELIEAALIEGAKRTKRGKEAKIGLAVNKSATLIYDGPQDPDALVADAKFHFRVGVKVNQAKVMRTRPRFDKWETTIEVNFDPTVLNAKDVKDFVEATGSAAGLGDWRPKFGRFEVIG